MPTTEGVDADGRWTARTPTGYADFTDVGTRWEDDAAAYVTRVAQRVGARWIPLEYHHSADEEQARITHRNAVRRHPRNGNAKTLPRHTNHGRCTRCGSPIESPHADDCRD